MNNETIAPIALFLAWLSWLGTVFLKYRASRNQAEYIRNVLLTLIPAIAAYYESKQVPNPPSIPEPNDSQSE